jgi:hypothetical protein
VANGLRSTTLGVEVAGIYDDVDDYNGYTDQVDAMFTRSVVVEYLDAPLNTAVTVSMVPTDFKQIKVTAYPISQPSQTYTVMLILANQP